ncbi:MAG: hypothetical protein ABIH23_23185 [bacterium]
MMDRRNFIITLGTTASGIALSGKDLFAATAAGQTTGRKKGPALVRGAFVYPPSESLKKVGYYSWPGSGFDAEGRQRQYMTRIKEIEEKLGMRISMDETPLDEEASVTRFISEVKQSQPDGLLLIPLKKGHWVHVIRIIEETQIPAVVLATLGILLVDHINQLHEKPGVYLINSLDNLDAVEDGMKMIKTARWMKDSRIVNIVGSEESETRVPNIGTEVRTIPGSRFVEIYQSMKSSDEVKSLAKKYLREAKKVVEPSKSDVHEAAKTYFVLKQILEAEKGDAVMMDCLPGLSRPHKHVPPCMGFMSLRDEGIAAGCQADLNPTLTMMLIQELFDRPAFQQNASMDTEKNHYFGAHCTCPSKLFGTSEPSEPYILRNHAEAGWGCVPRVLWRPGEEVTMALYISKEHEMLLYTGTVISSPDCPPAGGCRTNVEMTINEVDDVCTVKGMHQCIFYGNYAKQLKEFCQLYGITVVT